MTRVLLVDDDVELSAMLGEYLAREGFEVTAVPDGETGVAEALSGRHAIAVLDVMMPGIGGVEALRRIRAESRLPVLMLTARGDDVDRIVGLELGADDYVPKPCTPRELVARLRAILRRSQPVAADESGAPVRNGPLVLWPERREARWQERPLELTSTEFNCWRSRPPCRPGGEPWRTVGAGAGAPPGAHRPQHRRASVQHPPQLGTRADGGSWIQTVRGQGYQLARE